VDHPSDEVVDRVRQVLEHAAAAPIAHARAQVSIQRVSDVYGEATYDCPVVVLTPVDPAAARVVVELQSDDLWWMNANDGPGTELPVSLERDRYALLASLVRAVVTGRYRHGPCTQEIRRHFRSSRQLHGWSETFDTDEGPFTSRHFGREVPSRERRFRAY